MEPWSSWNCFFILCPVFAVLCVIVYSTSTFNFLSSSTFPLIQTRQSSRKSMSTNSDLEKFEEIAEINKKKLGATILSMTEKLRQCMKDSDLYLKISISVDSLKKNSDRRNSGGAAHIRNFLLYLSVTNLLTRAAQKWVFWMSENRKWFSKFRKTENRTEMIKNQQKNRTETESLDGVGTNCPSYY